MKLHYKVFRYRARERAFDPHESGHLAISTIEVSIFLLVFGVICGCVLQTREMLHQNEARLLMDKVSQIQAGMIAFKDTYHRWPGDFAPTLQDPFNGQVLGGNNNGIIDPQELGYVFEHLYLTGYLTQAQVKFFDQAAASCPGRVCLENGYGDWLSIIPSSEGYEIGLGKLPEEVFQSLDKRFDDGLFHSGHIKARSLEGERTCVDTACVYSVSWVN